MKNILCVLFVLTGLISCTKDTQKIDLSGKWTIALDSTKVGLDEHWEGGLYTETIHLPGTTDEARMGQKNVLQPELTKPQLLHLTRAHSYIGAAWYAREFCVPASWEGKEFKLRLERVIWDTQVWIDGQKVEGHEESLTTPHEYDLTPYIQCGKKQILTIRVNNEKRHQISTGELAHAYTEDTQVKWNGILGEIAIHAVDKIHIQDTQLYPDVTNHKVTTVLHMANHTEQPTTVTIAWDIKGHDDNHVYAKGTQAVSLNPGDNQVTLHTAMPENAPLWNEFDPYLYETNIHLEDNNSAVTETFGMRELKTVGNRFMLNNVPLFLRGNLECCIFPLTGTPPTDDAGWEKVYKAAKAYGLNHLRFHSWCPPEAAFRVADRMGFYLQVELPIWENYLFVDEDATNFVKAEAIRIRRNYGNHPSFCFWSLGNELCGDFDKMNAYVKELKEADPRHLYTNTSFSFQGGHGVWPEPNNDYLITQWANAGWVRGQGVFNSEAPSFDKDFRASIQGMPAPVVTHEVGQYAVYPDLTEIDKYTGTLLPLNFMAVRDDLKKKGLLEKAPLYLEASGKLATLLYKEEIERALKTPGISGFQLLDIHDFPGQGTALVGLLNAFWESKGVVSPAEFREYCSPMVPLLRFPKAVYTNEEHFTADIEMTNYGEKVLKNETITWEISANHQTIKKGTCQAANIDFGYNDGLGHIDVPLTDIQKATQLEVRLSLKGIGSTNHWNIWVYPAKQDIVWGDVNYTRNYDEAYAWLQQGKKVLFNPDWRHTKGIEGKFVPVFWSPVHFAKQAGTMGILCSPKHPALKNFPTDMHTDWQWWDLTINSTTLNVDSLRGGNAIVEMVDNFVSNRRLASIYEGSVGSGRLLLTTIDLKNDLDNRPVARQMLVSLLQYMNSENFKPTALEGFEAMGEVFGTTNNKKQSASDIY